MLRVLNTKNYSQTIVFQFDGVCGYANTLDNEIVFRHGLPSLATISFAKRVLLVAYSHKFFDEHIAPKMHLKSWFDEIHFSE